MLRGTTIHGFSRTKSSTIFSYKSATGYHGSSTPKSLPRRHSLLPIIRWPFFLLKTLDWRSRDWVNFSCYVVVRDLLPYPQVFRIKKKALLDVLLKFLKNKFCACWNAYKRLLKNLVDHKSYCPEPSLHIPAPASLAKKEILKLPTPVISLPLENKDLQDNTPINRTIFLSPPHPAKRAVSSQKRPDLPNLLSKKTPHLLSQWLGRPQIYRNTIS